jgi:hypothetical protein
MMQQVILIVLSGTSLLCLGYISGYQVGHKTRTAVYKLKDTKPYCHPDGLKDRDLLRLPEPKNLRSPA